MPRAAPVTMAVRGVVAAGTSDSCGAGDDAYSRSGMRGGGLPRRVYEGGGPVMTTVGRRGTPSGGGPLDDLDELAAGRPVGQPRSPPGLVDHASERLDRVEDGWQRRHGDVRADDRGDALVDLGGLEDEVGRQSWPGQVDVAA